MTIPVTDLTTLDTLKSYLNPGSNDDKLLQRLLSAASVAIENWLSRDVKSQAYTEFFDGTGGRVLVMPQNPVTAVASVTINGNAIPAGNVTTAGYYFTDTAIILTGYSFTRGNANVVVVYTAGYATIPYDLEQACIGLVQYWMGDRQRNGEVSRSMGGQTISYSQKDMPEWVKTTLMQYRRVVPA